MRTVYAPVSSRCIINNTLRFLATEGPGPYLLLVQHLLTQGTISVVLQRCSRYLVNSCGGEVMTGEILW